MTAAVSAPTLREIAIAYGARVPVFPVCWPAANGTCGCGRNHPQRNVGKAPLTEHGFLDATQDIGAIDAWWQQWPQAGIGMPTGAASGRVIIDIDQHPDAADGFETLRDLEQQHGRLPETLTAVTGSGGEHRHFAYVPGLSSAPLAPGIDMKADGGYIILPPSPHASGRAYEWDYSTTEIAVLPHWVIDLKSTSEQRDEPRVLPDTIPIGQRRSWLLSWAGSLRYKGASENVILVSLQELNAERCVPPLPDDEVRDLAADVAKRYSPGEAFVISSHQPTPESSPAPPLTSYTVDELLTAPDDAVDIVIGDDGEGFVLSRDGKLAVAGATGIGKSNLLLRLGRQLCEGSTFLRLPIPQPRRVLHVALEGSRRGMRKRIAKVWADATPEACERYRIAFAQLDVMNSTDALEALIAEHKADIVIIDPLRNAHGLDENSSQDMAKLTAVLDGIIARHDCALVIAHHDRKAPLIGRQDATADSVRGSTAFTGWLSACLALKPKPKAADVLLATWTKVRDAEEALPPLELEFQRGSIDFVASVRGEEHDVEDLVRTALYHNGALKKAEIVEIIHQQANVGKRAIENMITHLTKRGDLVATVEPADVRTQAKTYRLNPKQASWSMEDDE